MNKFKFLLLFGLKKRIARKSFIITNTILALAIMIIINIPALISIFGSDEEVEPLDILIVNETTDEDYPLSDTLVEYLNMGREEPRFQEAEGTLDDHGDFWEEGSLDILLVFSAELSQPEVDIYTKDNSLNNTLTSTIQVFLNEYQNINYGQFRVMDAPGDGEEGMDEETQAFIQGVSTIIILPVFILILMATQFLGVDIIEEKSSKAIETIISSVPSKIHFMTKILYNILFLIIQSALLLLFAFIGSLIGRLLSSSPDIEALTLLSELASRMPNWPALLAIMLLFLVFGTLLFLCLAALIAAIATTQEDYQQFQAPLILLILGGFYMAIFLPMMGFDTIVKAAAYIPFFSTLVAPIAYASGIINLFEVLISLFLLALTVVLFMYLITPVYRVAILSYEETKFFRRIRFYIKKAFSKR